MKKIVILPLILFSFILSSCLFQTPTYEGIFNEIIEENNFDKIYCFTEDSAITNTLIPEEEQNYPYSVIYTIYGEIDKEDVILTYGYAERGRIFGPLESSRPMAHSYDECLNLYSENLNGRLFNKDISDGITFLTRTDNIEELLDGNDLPDNNFMLRYNQNYYIYEMDGELLFDYIEL